MKRAGLPPHFTPHCLRHTFASLLLQKGVSPAYVQEQLGHSSITLTVDTYGKWLPKGNPEIADLLDDRSEPLANLVVAATFPTAKPPLRNCFLLSYLGLVDRMGIEPTTS